MKRSTYAEVVLLAATAFLVSCASNPPERLDKSPAYHWGYARAFAYSPDGRTLVALRDRLLNAAEILDANTLTVIHTLKGSEGPRMVMTAPPGSVVFSPNGDLLATAGVDDVVVLWDARTWKERRRLPDTKWASGVSFLPDGRTLATAGPGETVRLWDTDTGAQNASLEGQQGAAISVDVSRDGRLLAVGGIAKEAQLWDLGNRSKIAQFDQQVAPALSVAFSPDGKKLATSAAGLGALVWDVESSRAAAPAALQSTPSGAELSRALVFMAGLGSIATAATKGGVGYLIVPGSGTTLTNDFFCPVAISPDGKLLAVIQRSLNIKGDFQVEIYSLGSREKVAEYFSGISALAFSPDSKTLVVSGFFRAILIDPYTGKELPTSTQRNR